ncbi:putative DNA recombinase Stage IV sporulation protein CA [Proteiniborus sp. DW1]|uniref:recombinase family protein n=1 Tax=Proteiniborus sp. DW1 TaxID=1889883 RepID=UPI00092DF662|nr:recombinase family protein [Proteiniborus sp. DW1]SCG82673.1 putative DNA recombinase Stage IV sporulation protein CA [Proteiniborus sp. DW1]
MYALYARQSRDKKDSISIESQFEFCMKEVPEGVEVRKYKDKGYSGKSIERPEFQKLLKDIEKGIIEKVIVYRLDRMSRSTLDFARLMDYFKKYNTEFISTTEKFDTSTPIGKAMLSIVMVFAQLERETIQQRITDNYYERGKKGMFLGGNVPFGYELIPTRIDGKKTNMLSPTNSLGYVVDLYNKYVNSRASLKSLAFDLNEREIKTRFDNYWDSAKISRLLKNPVYVKADIDVYNYYKNMGCILHNDISEYTGENGLYVYGNNVSTSTKFQNLEGYHVVLAPHKGVIDSNTWLKCQHKLSKNKQIKNSGKSKYSWLSGLVKCKQCGYSMNINKATLSKKNNTSALYFRCSGRANKKICDSLSLKVDAIEQLVANDMFEYIENLSNKLKIDTVKENKKINELKTNMARIENEIENLIDNLTQAKGASMKYINKRIEKLDEELSVLNEELLKANQDNSVDDKKIIELKRLISIWDELPLDDKKEFAQALIDKVHIRNIANKIECKVDFRY